MRLLRRLKALFSRRKPKYFDGWVLKHIAKGEWNENGEMVWTPMDGSPPYVIEHTGKVEMLYLEESDDLTDSKK